jgi:uncharacterized protein (DUF427 family)
MNDDIRIRRAEGTWVVRAGGAVLGETQSALELTEGRMPPVIYFPRGDVAMAFLERSDKVTTCPKKGQAAHYDIVTKSTVLRNAAWSYEDPKESVAAIAGHIAFYPLDTVQLEQL